MFETKIYTHILDLAHISWVEFDRLTQKWRAKGWQTIPGATNRQVVVTKAKMVERA